MFGLTFALVAIILAIIYRYVNFVYSYWKHRGIPYLRPSIPFGNFSNMIFQQLSMNEQLAEIYRSTSEPFIGFYILHRPFLLICDPKLIRSILITDFECFTDHDFYRNEKDEPLTAILFTLRGQQWRDMRTKLSKMFNSTNMKMLFSVIFDCGNQLQRHLSNIITANEAIEVRELIGCYATNVLASAAFGIDADFLADPKHPFRKNARKLFEINFKNLFRFFGWFFQPKLLKLSGLRFIDRAVEDYFLKLVAEQLKMREENKVVRKDFFQFLVELYNGDSNSLDDGWNKKKKSLTIEQLTAQAFTFFLGGFEPITLTTSYCLFEIAKHPEIQQKVHAEIDRVMAQYNGELSYDSMNEFKYLACCFDETLRKYSMNHLERECTKDYKIPDSNVTIEKGTTIIIPTYALHRDEKFYPDPEKFDPTRFLSENRIGKTMVDMPYLPFGDGPRICIGTKMAKMSAKVCMISILQQNYVELDDRHIGKEIKFFFGPIPIDGIHLKFKTKNSPTDE